MPGLACNACNVEFEDETIQKIHYRSDWHRYNLKRKVAGVPGVTEGLFNLRLEAIAAEKKKSEGERLFYKCALCGKEYTTEKAHLQHLQSKLHLTQVSSHPDVADAGVAVTRRAPRRPTKEQNEVEEKRRMPVHVDDVSDSDEDEDWEEVSGEEAGDIAMEFREFEEAESISGSMIQLIDGDEWDVTRCFFCDLQPDGTVEGCVEHMHKAHGFFVPDVEYLKDAEGMLNYLGLKVTKGFMCLYCDEKGKRFQSLEAVRKHMISRSHCKLHYGDGEGADEEELEAFYDFSSSYASADGGQLMNIGNEGPQAPVALVSGGMELLIKGDSERSRKTLGSREFFRYYRQKPKPSDQRDGIVVNSIIARYRSMGLATRQEQGMPRNMVASRNHPTARAEAMRSKVGWKHNVIWNLPKNVVH